MYAIELWSLGIGKRRSWIGLRFSGLDATGGNWYDRNTGPRIRYGITVISSLTP